MDPVTAIFNALAALFNFLSTPAGQLMCGDIRSDINGIVALANKNLELHGSKNG